MTDDLARTVRRLLEQRLPSTDLVRDLGDPALQERVDGWLARDLGVADLLLDGGTLADTAAVARELGRACAPSDFVTSTVLAGGLLGRLDAARPGSVACVAIPWDAPPGALTTTVTTDGRTARGSVRNVAGLLRADLVVVPADHDGELVLLAVEPSEVRPVTSFDQTRPLADLILDQSPAEVVARGERAAEAIARALLEARAVLASEQVGLAEWCLAATVEHVSNRRQFGRLLGSFQALKHRLALAWVDVDGASAAAARAATAADHDDHALLVHVAQSFCSEVAVDVAESCLQLHGGTGMTWEHPLHVYLKRAVADRVALGSPEQHRRALADLVDLPA